MSQETSSAVTERHDKTKTLSRFYAVIAEVIGLDNVATDAHFLDVGGDSLSAAIIIDWLAQEYGAEPELDWFFNSKDVAEIGEQWWKKLDTAPDPSPVG
jgi:acyl carrier protein